MDGPPRTSSTANTKRCRSHTLPGRTGRRVLCPVLVLGHWRRRRRMSSAEFDPHRLRAILRVDIDHHGLPHDADLPGCFKPRFFNKVYSKKNLALQATITDTFSIGRILDVDKTNSHSR